MRLRIHMPEGTSEWESNVSPFRIGRADTCALRFEGESAKYASWEHAEFSVDAQGRAFVTDLGSGNGTFVDGARIAEATRLRSGVTIQIGTKGPRLEVLELYPAAPRPVPIPFPISVPVSNAATALAASTSRTAGPATWLQRHGLVVGLAIALLVVLGLTLLRKDAQQVGPEPAKPPDGSIAQAPEFNNGQHKSGEPKTDQSIEPDDERQQIPEPNAKPNDKGNDKRPELVQAFAAYRLIVAEDPDSHINYPLSGAVAVADHTLLTTAAPTIELAKFMDKRWPLKAMKPSDGSSVAIRDLRVHPFFQRPQTDDQLFYDVALLYTVEPLSDVAELATDDELEQLQVGRPLACIAADHDRIPFKGPRELTPAAHPGISLELHRAGGLPGVLALRGRFHDWYFGSPIVNRQSHLVAVYCGPAEGQDGEKHFAKVIDAELIQLGLNEPDNSIWSPVTASPTTQESAK